MNKLIKKILFLISAGLGFGFFTSCDSEITVKISQNGQVSVNYFSKPGDAVLKTVTSVVDDTDNVFDKEGIEESAESTGLENVDVSGMKDEIFNVGGKIPSRRNDVFSKSGLINKKNNKVYITRDTLFAFYENCPTQFQAYMDLFMAPVFTKEDMADEELADLIKEVYGKALADEVIKSKVTFILEKADGTEVLKTMSLLTLLNLQDDVVLE